MESSNSLPLLERRPIIIYDKKYVIINIYIKNIQIFICIFVIWRKKLGFEFDERTWSWELEIEYSKETDVEEKMLGKKRN